MRAALAIKAAWAAGVSVRIEGGDLVLQAAAAPPAALIDALARHKSEVVALLRPDEDGWTAEHWQSFLHRWTNIAKDIGGLSESDATLSAFACCITEWLNRYPARQATGWCLLCGENDRVGDPLLPFGTSDRGHAWLHFVCWPEWHRHRRLEAAAALARIGIIDPRDREQDGR
jgi:hypothetical protein